MPITPTPPVVPPSSEAEIPTATESSEDVEVPEITEDPRNIPVIEDDGSVVCHLVDLNLFSGSNDIFRTNVGGYFFNTINTSGNAVLSFSSFYRGLNGPFEDGFRPLNQYIESLRSYSEANVSIATGDSDKMIPSYKFVVSVDGKPDQIPSDKFWQSLWIGGTFNDVELESIYTNGAVFDDYYSVYSHPYSTMASEYLSNPAAISSYMDISYNYNKHLREYQSYTNGRNEKQLPNVHLNTWAYLYRGGHEDESTAEATPEIPSKVYDFVSRDGQIENIQGSFEANIWQVDEDNPSGFYTGETSPEFISYLDEDLPEFEIADETRSWANNKFRNVFFNDGYFSTVYPEVLVHAPHYPYYIKIDCPTETQGFVGNAIASAGFSSRMLRMLKEIFSKETNVKTPRTQFEKNKRYLTSSVGSEANTVVSETSTKKIKGVDLIDLLLYSYRKIKSTKNNFLLIEEPNIEYASTYDKKGTYRHLNTSNTLEVLNSVLSELGSQQGIRNIRSLLNVQRDTPIDDADIANNVPEYKYSEVIAYRIEKQARRRVGDGTFDIAPIQNFWLFNSVNLNELEFFDTQVKYDKRYIYKIYQYRLIQGLKYRYSKLQLSRVIGMPNAEMEASDTAVEEGDPDYVPTYYCIEYYDPYTDEAVNDLLKEGIYEYTGGDDDSVSSLAGDSVRIATSREPGDSRRPFFANFVVTTQPSLKIFEIPYMRKSLRVLDSPPNKLGIYPTYMDNVGSNTLKFELYHEGFDGSRGFPTTVTERDERKKNQYLNSNNLLETGIIKKETVSQQVTMQVYRLDRKPRSFKDFDGALIQEVDLKMDISENAYTGDCVYDTIQSNKKFYYAFRTINENGMPGHMDEIVQAEYVNDGGYKYALFDVLYKEDLEEKAFSNITIDSRNLLQIVPNTQHTILDTTDANFGNPAATELSEGKIKLGSAEDLIWEKTFKIRLTSKKTGKKIDLNVTYKQNNDILGSE